jgi:hypothetical protein
MAGEDANVDLDAVADELYGLTPADFTPARQARAVEARQAGDRELAAAIRKLRRPTTGAWLVNLLRRERTDDLVALLDLGEATRQAQTSLDAEAMRRLSRERRRLVAGLAQEGRRLAAARGQAVSDAVGRQLEGTLEAAFADPDASAAVRSGRLTTALDYSGLGLLGVAKEPDADDVETAEEPDVDEPETAQERGVDEPETAEEPGVEDAETAAAQALGEARAALAEAEHRAGEAERRLADAREHLEQRRQQVRDLERRLRDLRDAEEQAAHEVVLAEGAATTAQGDVQAAADQVDRARAASKR